MSGKLQFVGAQQKDLNAEHGDKSKLIGHLSNNLRAFEQN